MRYVLINIEYTQRSSEREGGRDGQLPTPSCPRLSNCHPLAFGLLMHKIEEN